MVCATRTRGKTCELVKSYGKDYGIIWNQKLEEKDIKKTRNEE